MKNIIQISTAFTELCDPRIYRAWGFLLPPPPSDEDSQSGVCLNSMENTALQCRPSSWTCNENWKRIINYNRGSTWKMLDWVEVAGKLWTVSSALKFVCGRPFFEVEVFLRQPLETYGSNRSDSRDGGCDMGSFHERRHGKYWAWMSVMFVLSRRRLS